MYIIYVLVHYSTSTCTYLSSEATEESKDELRECKGKVLVEEISKEGRHSVVRPLTMHQQEAL